MAQACPAMGLLHPTLELASLFLKVLSDFCRNLPIGHLVLCFNSNDALTKILTLYTCFELALCLTRAKDQNGLRVTKMRDHLIVIIVKMLGKLSVSLVICRVMS